MLGKKAGIALAGCVLVILLLLPLLPARTAKKTELPVELVIVDMLYDPSEPKAALGFCDYVFVATVEKEEKTWYILRESRFDPENGKWIPSGDPRTDYTVRVRQTVKGELPVDSVISLTMDGGVGITGDCISLSGFQALPEEGGTYLFTALTQAGGSLMCSGTGCLVPLSPDYSSDPILKSYTEAYSEMNGPKREPGRLCRYDPAFVESLDEAELEAVQKRTERAELAAAHGGYLISRRMLRETQEERYPLLSETEVLAALLREEVFYLAYFRRGLNELDREEVAQTRLSWINAFSQEGPGPDNPIVLFCEERKIDLDSYFSLAGSGGGVRAHLLLCDALAREYCETHGLEYRPGAQPDEVNAAVEAELDKLFEEHKGEIVYY